MDETLELSFGQKVRAWRQARGVSQREVERFLGKTRGYITQIEKGTILPVERQTCELLGERLGVAGDEVWAALMDARLRRARPDLQAHAKVRARTLGDLTADEAALVQSLRDVDKVHTGGPPTAAALLRLARLVVGSASHTGAAPLADPAAAVRALRELNECSAWTVGEVLAVVVRVVAALERERESLGYVLERDAPPVMRRTKPRRGEAR